MSETYLIAAAQGKLSSLSTASHGEQVRPILQSLFEKSGAPARRVEEIHWHGGDEEFWFNSLGRLVGLAPEVASFHWPVTALLAHTMLQNMARAIEAGGRDLVIIGQETRGQAVALLLASPSALGRHNLSPRACLGAKLAVSSAPGGLLQAVRTALQKADEAAAAEAAGTEDEKKKESSPDSEIRWMAASRSPEADSLKTVFPGARWIGSDPTLPPGDLFLLAALVERLEKEQARRGLLLSEGPQKSGLATLVERV